MPRIAVLLAVVIGSTVVGCGEAEPERAAVAGQVTYKGKPLEDGEVRFFSKDHREAPVVTAQISGGQYSLTAEEGPFVGANRIEITAFKKTGRQVPDLSRENQNNPDRPMIDEVVPILPAEFNTQSRMTRDIVSGDNTAVDFNL